MRHSALYAAVCAAMMTGIASAATVETFSDFTAANSTGIQLNGDAAVGVTSTAGDLNTLQLDPTGEDFQFGTAFGKTPLQAASGFSTEFQFRFTDPGGISDGTAVGADGLTFTVQNVSSSAGEAGEGIGYQGIGNSVAVKFDTFQNTENNDPSSNYIGVASNGDVNNADYPGGSAVVVPDFDNGTIWTAWIDYNGTTLSAYAVDSATAPKPSTPLITYDFNVPSILGSSTAYVGFTGAGGEAYENTYILNWSYSDFYNPTDNPPSSSPGSTVPLPAAWEQVGILLGFLAAGWTLKRFKAALI